MTREEAYKYGLEWLKDEYLLNAEDREFIKMAIEALSQEPCEDCISRREAIKKFTYNYKGERIPDYDCDNFPVQIDVKTVKKILRDLPSVSSQKTGHCRECKYFEYDSVAKVNGIPLIVAHEICSKWGDGCKTKEDGYCFLFDPQERSDKE